MLIINLHLKSISFFLLTTNEYRDLKNTDILSFKNRNYLYFVEIPKGSIVKYHVTKTNSTFFVCGWGECSRSSYLG